MFFFAGPCCFYIDHGVGNAALYFAPGTESNRPGSATPFDSGALEPPPQLQPYRKRDADVDDMWGLFEDHRVGLAQWREGFADWLAYCYDDPARYIETTPDRYAAGQPNRTRPALLLEHNGTRGVERHGVGQCGDRRAWTWEVRIGEAVSIDEVAVIQVGFADFAKAHAFADDIEARSGHRPHVHVLPRDVVATHDNLWTDSYAVLQHMVR